MLSEITLALLSNAESEIKIQMKTTTNSKWMKMKAVFFPFSQKCNLAAAWLSKELRRHNSQVLVEKLNGDNSHAEKERVTRVFREG